jgi:hypothetical protein
LAEFVAPVIVPPSTDQVYAAVFAGFRLTAVPETARISPGYPDGGVIEHEYARGSRAGILAAPLPPKRKTIPDESLISFCVAVASVARFLKPVIKYSA